MPIIPNIKDTGTENNVSNPPRIERGLPQPGWTMYIVTITAPTAAIKTADIFPKSTVAPM
jgi:hypothetical protein